MTQAKVHYIGARGGPSIGHGQIRIRWGFGRSISQQERKGREGKGRAYLVGRRSARGRAGKAAPLPSRRRLERRPGEREPPHVGRPTRNAAGVVSGDGPTEEGFQVAGTKGGEGRTAAVFSFLYLKKIKISKIYICFEIFQKYTLVALP